jgi:hypothetical protein
MKDGAPFGIAGIWENWREPASGEWLRTFAINGPGPYPDAVIVNPVSLARGCHAPDGVYRWKQTTCVVAM